MSTAAGDKFDYFLSRRGSVAALAQEVENVLAEKGYRVFVQDYDIALGASFIEAMHEAIKHSRDLVILFTGDYEASPFTRKEFTSFEADRHHGGGERHVVILRCEDVPLRGLLADNVYQDLVGVTDPSERRARIIAAVERQSAAQRPARRRGKTFVGVPPRIAGFTGRADALERVDAILTSDQPVAVTQLGRAAVQGMGGVGKTSLVIEYAHRYRNLYDGVWWCPAETRASLMTSLAALAVELDAASPEEAGIEAAARAALRRLGEQRDIWLLVYDNVSIPQDIADLLPAGVARVLITSRFSDWSAWADEVSLDVLPIEEAMAFLQDRAGHRDDDGARLLAEALGRLPLALDHAAATCRRTQMSFAAYATKASSLISAAPRGAGYPRSVAATFDLAIDDAAGQCPAAAALMEYLAQCAPERIPMTLIEGAIDDETARMDALAALCEVSLVKHEPFDDGAPAVSVHRLVQAVVRARADANANPQRAATRVLERLAATYPGDGNINAASWPRCASLTPHLLAVCGAQEAVAGTKARRANLLTRAGDYFYGRGAYAAARPCFEHALAIHETIRGPKHPSTAKSLNKLAPLLQALGDLAGARALYERALEIREHALGPEHADTAASLINLGSVLREQGGSRGRGRPWSGRWRSTKRPAAPTIPRPRRLSTTSPACCRTRATWRERCRCASGRWRSTRRSTDRSIPPPREGCATSPISGARKAIWPRPGRSSSAHWRSTSSCAGSTIPRPPGASITWRPWCTSKATWRLRGRCTSVRSRSSRRRSAPSIPIRHGASATWPTCSRRRAIMPERRRSTGARSRSGKSWSARRIPIPIGCASTLRACCWPTAMPRRRSRMARLRSPSISRLFERVIRGSRILPRSRLLRSMPWAAPGRRRRCASASVARR